jgi:xanthine dehydrogenase YagR molybdenum-binding subunit
VHWLDEQDTVLNPMGAKDVDEIGIVGAAAAVGNAVGRYFAALASPDCRASAHGSAGGHVCGH